MTSHTDTQNALSIEHLREKLIALGADDIGFISLDRPEIADQKARILEAFPKTRSLISFVVKMNREPVRSPARSISNLEFHQTGEQVNHIARKAVRYFESLNIPAMNPTMGFPMEMDKYPEHATQMFVVSHKPVAAAAGLGKMGIHRNIIHPKFGNFILLGTILVAAELKETQPIDYNPCLKCKLCVAVCPVGAIAPDGHFNATACYTHNYREFMGGFSDWVETVADSKNSTNYRERVSRSETASLWQSLSFGANYKAAYCLSVCPAGEDVIQPFIEDRKGFLQDYVKPLQKKPEQVFVVKGSDAESHLLKRFPEKTPRYISSGLTPNSITAFINGLPLAFQRGASKGLSATYHFVFTGKEPAEAYVRIHEQQLQVWKTPKDIAQARNKYPEDLKITANSKIWIRFLNKDYPLIIALLSGKLKLKGSPKHLLGFAKCFPG